MTLKETILKYADILNEDLNASQAGNLIINLKNKDYNDKEIVKSLDGMVKRFWVKVDKQEKYKTIYVSIIPKDWSGGNGISVEDAIVGHYNNENASYIRVIVKKWVNSVLENLKQENKGYNIILHDRKNDKDLTITA